VYVFINKLKNILIKTTQEQDVFAIILLIPRQSKTKFQTLPKPNTQRISVIFDVGAFKIKLF